MCCGESTARNLKLQQHTPMGRLSLVAATRRHHHHEEEDDEESHCTETFPRQFPRTGTAFQIRTLPSVNEVSSYTSSRASPLRMSDELPFRTQAELEDGDGKVSAESTTTRGTSVSERECVLCAPV